jgi:hypothetical protein
MLASTNLFNRLEGHPHDVKAVVNNLVFCLENIFLAVVMTRYACSCRSPDSYRLHL